MSDAAIINPLAPHPEAGAQAAETTDAQTATAGTAPEEAALIMPCQIFSRVVGYLSPVQGWHPGKQQEWKDRVTFEVPQ